MPIADATPIGTGPAFLADHNIVRGFKIHASVVDPLAVPMVAQTIDIETAVYDGRISAADSTGFTFVRRFVTAADNYTRTLNYICQHLGQRPRCRWQSGHRLQVVELRVSRRW